VEVEQLSNGKFAVYLSNNGYDVDQIHDMIRLIYRLHAIVTSQDSGSGSAACFKVTPEAMSRVDLYLKDFADKVRVTRTHLKEAMSLMGELAFDSIERVLKGQVDASSTPVSGAGGGAARLEVGRGGQCGVCKREFKTSSGLARHKCTPTGRPGRIDMAAVGTSR